MLGNESVWDAALASHAALAGAGVPHAVAGGVGVCLHGYQRNTVDVDLLIRADDAERVRQLLLAAGWRWEEAGKEFVSDGGIPLHLLMSGMPAGRGTEVRLPDPASKASVTELEGLPVLTLPRLIEAKLAAGQNDARRMHKDFADVIELVAHHNLQRSFSRKLDPSLRAAFLDLVERARAE